MYPLINIFGRDISTYGVVSIVGLIAAAVVFYVVTRKEKYLVEDVVFITLIAALGVMVGGHILFTITNIPGIVEYCSVPRNWGDFNTWKTLFESYCGGLVYYGGLLGSIGAVYLFVNTKYMKKTVNPKEAFNLYVVVVPLFHAFGRVGCFLGGCCYGIECEFGFAVHDNPISPGINGPTRFPTPLLESLCCLIIFAVLLVMWLKNKWRDRMLYIYFLMYPVVRFLDEFLRGDEIRGIWFGLSTSQWISIALFIIGLVNLIVLKCKEKR